MKKTYIAPGMKIVKVQTAAGMLAGSRTMDVNNNNITVRGTSALSRESGFSFWDDDEGDDED